MRNTNPSLRFDHREIAVIFSLFIFVSLLMFTVGILVGKGLAQAKYESLLLTAPAARTSSAAPAPLNLAENDGEARAPQSNERSAPPAEKFGEPTHASAVATSPGAKETAPTPTEKTGDLEMPKDAQADAKKPGQQLELIPQHARNPDVNGGSLQEPGLGKDAEHLMKDPKIRALLDKDDGPVRNTASAHAPSKVPPTASKNFPTSVAKGAFTVQVGSYPTQKDASERVEALKKLGFPHAYFSAKELDDKREVWYRVWLGYYPDKDTAEKSGAMLRERGEVKNYLVRKADGRT